MPLSDAGGTPRGWAATGAGEGLGEGVLVAVAGRGEAVALGAGVFSCITRVGLGDGVGVAVGTKMGVVSGCSACAPAGGFWATPNAPVPSKT